MSDDEIEFKYTEELTREFALSALRDAIAELEGPRPNYTAAIDKIKHGLEWARMARVEARRNRS